jgi:leucyl-tRNA synthetase
VSSDQVTERDGKYYHTETGEELKQIVAKMSKSLKNVINPDDVISRYGADSLRLYEMFMGPLDAAKPWDDKGVKGVLNFLARSYRLLANDENITGGEEDPEILRSLHQTIKKVTDDIENLRFNTAISAMMIFLNTAMKKGKVTRSTAKSFITILSPFAPHLGEELWQLTGNRNTIAFEPWPLADERYLKASTFECPVSVNGKMRFKIELPTDLPQEEIREIVLADERAKKWIGDATPKVIIVPNRIVNIVL